MFIYKYFIISFYWSNVKVFEQGLNTLILKKKYLKINHFFIILIVYICVNQTFKRVPSSPKSWVISYGLSNESFPSLFKQQDFINLCIVCINFLNVLYKNSENAVIPHEHLIIS